MHEPLDLPGTLAACLYEIADDRRPMPTYTEAKRHHFVPQFILRGFVDAERSDGRLWQCDKHSGQVVPVTTEAAASRHRLYRVNAEGGGHTDHLEAFLALVEDHSAPSIRSLLAEPLTLPAGDRLNIAFLLGLQELRTPGGQERFAGILKVTYRLHLSAQLTDRNAHARHVRKYEPDASAARIEERRQEALTALRDGTVRLVPPKELLLEGMLEGWQMQSDLLHSLRWKVMQTRQAAFVIGDRPLTWHDRSPRFPWSVPAPLSSPDSVGLMPLSATSCLRTDQRGSASELRQVTRQVRVINLRSWGWADRHVFGTSRETLLELQVDALGHPELSAAPPQDSTVILEDADPRDLTVGSEHPAGWPRGLRQRNPNGGPDKFCSYTVVRCDEDTTPTIDDRYLDAA